MMRNRRSFLLALALGVFLVGWNRPARADDAIATADSEAPGMQLQVTKLKRAGDSVMLQFTVINNSDADADLNTLWGQQDRSVDGVYLVDLAGKKKYEVVRDTDKSCVCSHDLHSGSGSFKSKSSVNLWAKFPAPPDSVQKLGVVVPHFMPMDDVPLSQ